MNYREIKKTKNKRNNECCRHGIFFFRKTNIKKVVCSSEKLKFYKDEANRKLRRQMQCRMWRMYDTKLISTSKLIGDTVSFPYSSRCSPKDPPTLIDGGWNRTKTEYINLFSVSTDLVLPIHVCLMSVYLSIAHSIFCSQNNFTIRTSYQVHITSDQY